MEKIKIIITTLSPVIVTAKMNSPIMTESNDFFNGSIIRGMMAGQYIKAQHLDCKAHENQGFRGAFFGNLRFVDAYPVKNHHRSMVLPLSLQKSKKSGKLQDLLVDEGQRGFKSLKGLGLVDKQFITPVSVQKDVTLHMSRNTEQERLSGKSIEGHIYNYESIDKGQCFEGMVIGTNSDLKDFQKALRLNQNSFVTSIGRSRYTQYGLCHIQLSEIETIPEVSDVTGATVYIRLETPYIPANGQADDALASFRPVVEFLQDQYPNSTFTLLENQVFAASVDVDNYVGVWNMHRPRQKAIAAGSVFALQKTSGVWTEQEIHTLAEMGYVGLGLRVEEGFGQMRYWQSLPRQLGKAEEFYAKVQIQNNKVREIASSIVMKYILAQVREMAFSDVQELPNIAGMGHFFSELEKMLGTRNTIDGIKNKFAASIKQRGIKEKTITRHLKDIKVNGKDLYDMLTGIGRLPYAHHDWHKGLPEQTEKLMADIHCSLPGEESDELFYEYWSWFFRHARKKAVVRGDDTI
jgi:CRISPR-associated protein Csx10